MSRIVASKYPSHAIIFDYLVSKRTGVLTFEPGSRKLYFENGQLIFASSDHPEEHFASILVTTGTLSESQLERAKREAQTGTSLGRQLKTMGYATSQQLAHALKQQITMIVDRAVSLQGGDCQSQETELPPKLPKLKIQTLGLIIKSILKMDSDIFAVPVQIDQPLYKTARGDVFLSKIATPPSYLELFNFLGENVVFNPGTLQEIAQLDGDQLKKMIYVLHQLGILAFKDETSAIQEPLEDLTSDGDSFQDETFEEDALATVLPATTPPKTDLSAAKDPQRAIRKINLPDFSQMARPDFAPTLKVQDPRRANQELGETVRQFEPLLQNKDLDFNGDEGIPDFDKAISLDQDLNTISRELDPGALEEIPESDDSQELLHEDSLLTTDSLEEEIDHSFDTEPGKEDLSLASLPPFQERNAYTDSDNDSWENANFETSAPPAYSTKYSGNERDIPTALPDFSELLNNNNEYFSESVSLEPNPTPEALFDTEPALPVSDFLHSEPEKSTHQFPKSFSETAKDFDSKTPSIPSSVIMPEPESSDEPFYGQKKRPKGKRSILKPLLLGAILIAGAYAVFRIYESQSSVDLLAGPGSTENDGPIKKTPPDESLDSLQEDVLPPSSQVDFSNDPEAESSLGEVLEEPQKSAASNTAELQENNFSPTPDQETPLPKPMPPAAQALASPFGAFIQESATRFKNESGIYSLVLIVACQSETVDNVLSKWPEQNLFLFTRQVNGSECWMITWGTFPTYASAAKGRAQLPQAFKQDYDTVWIVKPVP